MRTLRSPGGCPWDREQTLRSLRPFLLEETYEALEAIDAGTATICGGTRDLLFEVFLVEIAREQGASTIDEAIETIADKLVRRHPHARRRRARAVGGRGARPLEGSEA